MPGKAFSFLFLILIFLDNNSEGFCTKKEIINPIMKGNKYDSINLKVMYIISDHTAINKKFIKIFV